MSGEGRETLADVGNPRRVSRRAAKLVPAFPENRAGEMRLTVTRRRIRRIQIQSRFCSGHSCQYGSLLPLTIVPRVIICGLPSAPRAISVL